MGSQIPVPSFIPAIHHRFSDYLVFDLNVPAIHSAIYLAYYFALEPFAAVRCSHYRPDESSLMSRVSCCTRPN
jgi:hypothetical protein